MAVEELDFRTVDTNAANAARESTREKWRHEDELIHQRTTWLLTSQGVLFAGFAAAAAVGETKVEAGVPSFRAALLVAFPLIGFALTRSIQTGLCAARQAMYHIGHDSAQREYLRDVVSARRSAAHVANPSVHFDVAWSLAQAEARSKSGVVTRCFRLIDRLLFLDAVEVQPDLDRVACLLAETATRGTTLWHRSQEETAKASAHPGTGSNIEPTALANAIARIRRAGSAVAQALARAKAKAKAGARAALSLPPTPVPGPTLPWPYWRPDVTTHTSLHGDTAAAALSRTILVAWISFLLFGGWLVYQSRDPDSPSREVGCDVRLVNNDLKRNRLSTIDARITCELPDEH